MPRMNKWLADRMATVFANQFHSVTVTHTSFPVEGLKRVRFEGNFSGVTYVPGNVIEFRVTDEDFRHYTPAHFDLRNGVCDVLFYLHGHGVGSDWAESLQAGDTTHLMGPGNKMALRDDCSEHVLFGDESSLGFALTMLGAVGGAHQTARCLLELDAAHTSWAADLGIDADIVSKDGLNDSLAQLDDLAPGSKAAFYLTGRAKSIQTFKQLLK